MLTIDIDTGGTMTDALVTDGATRHCIKVDTTPHDFTVSFQECLREAARVCGEGEDLNVFLRKVSLIRWSSTITTNVLAQRRGAKVGLLVSKGQEENLYGQGRSAIVDELVDADAVLGLPESPEAKDILLGVKSLLESGVRRICVALEGAFPDNRKEVAIKRVIESQYPDHIIGSVPVLLGSDMAQIAHDQTRAHYSVMNAYTHSHLATSLFKAEDILRDDHGWRGALLIGQTSGGVARIGKTKAVDTIESGPVFGTFGGAFVAREYGIKDVVCFDVGGTTTKCSVVRDGAPVFQRGGHLMEVPVQTSFAMLRSAAIGGGSVARVKDGRLRIGPESQGAAPGPACYSLGGREATLTDAILLLGYLDAERFLGGRRKLSIDQARKLVASRVAKPLDVSVEQAALMIRDEAVSVMAELVTSTLKEAGMDAGETALFAFGGNGPMFAALLAEKVGMQRVHAFEYGPVFGAFGSSVSDVAHVYERGIGQHWGEASKAMILDAAQRLHMQAVRDLLGEGFDPDKADFTAELEVRESAVQGAPIAFKFSGAPDAVFVQQAGEALQGQQSQEIVLLRLSASLQLGKAALPAHNKPVQAAAKAGARDLQFDANPPLSADTWVWEQLSVGEQLSGPAVINGDTMTCPIPTGWNCEVDACGNAALRRSAQ
tara:strand:+ start:1009 stop:2988 length:1980 start_codon:yes stop_codon:yes gene_type:complete